MHACKKLCKQCPFGIDAPKGWLGPYKDATELHLTVMNGEAFPCHMTQTSERARDVGNADNPLCAGSIIYMKKHGKLPHNNAVLKHVQAVTPEQKDLVHWYPELIKHHTLVKL